MIRRYIHLFLFFCPLPGRPHQAFAQSTETDLLSAAQQAFNDGFSDVATRYLEDFLDKFPQSPNLTDGQIIIRAM